MKECDESRMKLVVSLSRYFVWPWRGSRNGRVEARIEE